MYKIKQKPEDFIVKEISNIKLDSKGKYTYFLLKKKDYTTLRALEMTARELRTPVKKFGFAGNKDRRAVTSQLCSAEGVSEKRLEEVKLKDIEISFKGKGDKPVCLGDLEGNSFEIVVRNISSKPELKQKFVN
ncbi:tRNA pseudouridine(13) synthase TruD, partial [Candidatus Woesearchaeota archaeon]|nr:tRNA pseudouridine(13) synthase TruD [Candidatus Woesearchaeota archaeon]